MLNVVTKATSKPKSPASPKARRNTKADLARESASPKAKPVDPDPSTYILKSSLRDPHDAVHPGNPLTRFGDGNGRYVLYSTN